MIGDLPAIIAALYFIGCRQDAPPLTIFRSIPLRTVAQLFITFRY